MLTDLIAQYHAAKIVWEKHFDEDDQIASNSPEWHAYEAACAAVIEHACANMADVRAKATFLLENENAFDSVRTKLPSLFRKRYRPHPDHFSALASWREACG